MKNRFIFTVLFLATPFLSLASFPAPEQNGEEKKTSAPVRNVQPAIAENRTVRKFIIHNGAFEGALVMRFARPTWIIQVTCGGKVVGGVETLCWPVPKSKPKKALSVYWTMTDAEVVQAIAMAGLTPEKI